METDYDDLCNGLGEWKNIQPILRAQMFSQAQDQLTLKAHIVELTKRLVQVEKDNKQLYVLVEKPDEQLTNRVQQLEGQVKSIQSTYKQQLESLEERILEQQYGQNALKDHIKTVQQETRDLITQQVSQFDGKLKQLNQQYSDLSTQYNQFTSQVTSNYAKLDQLNNYALQTDVNQRVQEMSTNLSTQTGAMDRKVQQLSQNTKSQLENAVRKIESVVVETQQQGLSKADVEAIAESVFADHSKVLASKQIVQQICGKLNDKLTAQQKNADEAAVQVKEQVFHQVEQIRGNVSEMTQRVSAIVGEVSSVKLDNGRIIQLDREVKQLSQQLATKLDSTALTSLNRQLVTHDVLDEEIRAVLETCQKQIRNEVESFVDNSLYRTVKSIIKAEVDIVGQQQKNYMDNELTSVQEKLTKRILKEVSPQESLDKIDQQCDDIRQLVEMVSSDVDYKMQKVTDDMSGQLQTEVTAVRQALDAINQSLQTQGDVVVCKLKEYDTVIQSASISAQLPTARWSWRTKKVTSQQAIVWTSEESNTLQSNFIWERGKSQILVVAAGCYKIEFAVFARKRPTVQLVVNNEPILSAMSGGVAPALYVAPKGPAAGCYYAQSHSDFVYLAQNTVVQLVLGSEFSSCLSGYFLIQKQW